MRGLGGFGPSLIAFLAGVAWLVLSTKLIPAGGRNNVVLSEHPVALADAGGPCTTATMVARMPEVPEASGLALSRSGDMLWTHNDSGQPMIYGVGIDGRLRARVPVEGAEVEDWEDIATGACPSGTCLYIADIGDNGGHRSRVAIYRVPEPAPGDGTTQRAEVFYATYPEGPQDAEAFFVDPGGAFFIVTKGEGSPISVYRFPNSPTPGSTSGLERVATLARKARKDDRVTDADMSADGKWVALRTLESIDFYRADRLLHGAPTEPIAVDLTKLGEPQGEGIALMRDGTVFLAGESGKAGRGGTLARVSCKLP